MGVSVRQQKRDGKWFVYIRHAGQRVAQQAADRETAEEIRDEIRKEIRRGVFNIEAMRAARAPEVKTEVPSTPTVSEYFEKFKKLYLATACREGTRQRYDTSFKHILPELGVIPIGDITRERIMEFVAHLVAKRFEKRIKVKTYPDPVKLRNPVIEWKVERRPLSRTSVHIILNELCKLLSYAVENNVIQSNPALKLGKHYKGSTKPAREKIQPLNAEEVQAFLSAVLDRSWSKDYYPVFLVAIHTGMRAGEIVGLQWGDLDFRGKYFLLQRQFTRGRIEPTKTGSARRVDMSDALLTELQALKKRRTEEYFGKPVDMPEWVFINAEGKPLDYYNLRRRHFEKCLAHAGLRRIRFHDLRHTFATLLLMNGESPAYVKDQLGHASIKMTVDTYGHWIPGANRQAVNRLPVPGGSLRTAKAAG